MKKLLIAALMLSLTVGIVEAQTVSGRLFSSLYSWEREVFGADAERYTQMYSGALLHVRQIGNKDISFHTYVRFGNVLTGENLTTNHKLYNTYLEWKNIGEKVDLSFGRQYIWAGVGNGTLDGVKGEIDFSKWGSVGAYAGTLVPLRDSWKVDSWSTSNMTGAYYKNTIRETNLQISWVRKNRKPVEYTVPGLITGRIMETSALQANLLGIDLSRGIGKYLTVYTRAEGTVHKTNFSPDRVEVSADYMPSSKFSFSGQYFYRNPQQNLNSIFSVFSQTASKEISMNAFYYLKKSVTIFGGIARIDLDGEESNRYNVGFSTPYFSFGGNKYSGYSGDLDNFYFAGQYPVRPELWAKATFSAGRYKLYDSAVDYNNMVSSSAGISYQPRPQITFDIEGQGIKNELSKTDYRVLSRINYWFFKRNQ